MLAELSARSVSTPSPGPPLPSPRALRRERGSTRGVTLLELLVVLALLGIVAAVAVPALAPARPRDTSLHDVVRAAREAAVARAQLLSLTIAADGRWEVRALPPDDAARVAGGTLEPPPSTAFRLQLTPLGACLAASPLPPALRGWDAAGCTAPALAPDGRAGRDEGGGA